MAVERVIGKTDSFEVIFDRLNDNNWTVNVPSNIIGEYVMDLYAYDEAGNLGFLATAMFTVDASICAFIFQSSNTALKSVLKVTIYAQSRRYCHV